MATKKAAPKRRATKKAAKAADTVTKGTWVTWSGRQHKTIDEQAARYGAPIGGRSISLPEVAKWIHDFLADNARRLKSQAGDNEHESLEYWKTQRERLRYESEIAQRLDRHDVHTGLGRMAGILWQAGEALQREFPGAEVVLNQALEDYEREMDRLFGDDHNAKS